MNEYEITYLDTIDDKDRFCTIMADSWFEAEDRFYLEYQDCEIEDMVELS